MMLKFVETFTVSQNSVMYKIVIVAKPDYDSTKEIFFCFENSALRIRAIHSKKRVIRGLNLFSDIKPNNYLQILMVSLC